MRRWMAAVVVAASVGAGAAWAQSPTQELDQNWINVCPGAVPGTPYYERCQEIINAGPGSGNRRSAAATGNNLETVAAEGRSTAKSSDTRQFELSEGRFNFFASGNSGWGTHAATDREHGFDTSVQTFLVGFDYLVNPSMIAGLGITYETNGVDFQNGVGDLRSRRYSAMSFMSYSLAKALSFDGYLGYDRLSHDAVRAIDYVIVLNAGQPTEETRQIRSIATGNVDGGQVQAGGDVGYVWSARALSLMPHVAVDYVGTALDPYAETDQVGLAMAYDRQSFRSLTLRTGLMTTMALSRPWGVLTPQVRAEWVHEFENAEREIRTRFVGDVNGHRIALRTDAPDREYALVGGGVTAVLPGGFSTFIHFQGSVGLEQMREQRLSMGLRARL